ncbi:MAG: class I SAM-dependent RNA methyltransferase [Clostridia bacterium]|nr:class I SAM-dependent RNA methyltransferase [Clostridia bacterium]
MSNYKLSVNCASGVEGILKRELIALGIGEQKAINGSFVFDGDANTVAICNMFLHTAEHVYLQLGEFVATNFDDLFDGIFAIDWANYLSVDASIIVNAKSVKSDLFALSAIQSISKKAIIKKLTQQTKNTVFLETGARYGIIVSVVENTVSVLLDTGGLGLHKRGYRDFVSVAPMKETLACACLLLSDFSYDIPFCDPFCGSGTILTEAGRMALGIAPGRDRDFDFCHWQNFDQQAYINAKQMALDTQKLDRKLDFFASDIDKEAVKLTNRHILRAGLMGKVTVTQKDVKDLVLPTTRGTIVTNPPYGERLMDLKDAQKVVALLGKATKNAHDWSVFAISSDGQFERAFGKRADKKRKLYNARKECNLYQYFKQSNERQFSCKISDIIDLKTPQS